MINKKILETKPYGCALHTPYQLIKKQSETPATNLSMILCADAG